jgi:hypothetical protein
MRACFDENEHSVTMATDDELDNYIGYGNPYTMEFVNSRDPGLFRFIKSSTLKNRGTVLSALESFGWSASRPGRLTAEKKTRYSLHVARGGVVFKVLRYKRQVAGSIPDGVIGIFQ